MQRDISAKIANNLREFGYSDLTDDYVHDICEQLERHIPPMETGGGVIAMFAHDMMRENGLIEPEIAEEQP